MKSSAYLVSDVHLGADPEVERSFRAWLREVGSTARDILVNGDLFDFWFEYRTVVPYRYARALAALADLSESGVRVRMTGGNHDCWGGDLLRHFGIEYTRAPVTARIAGKKLYMVHGDGLGQGDFGYRLLRRVLRARTCERLFRLLHPDWGLRLAERASRRRGGATKSGPAPPSRQGELNAWAAKKLRGDRSLDIVAVGHSHAPEVIEPEPGRYVVNAGDWVVHRSFAEIRPGEAPRIRSWPEG